MATRKKPEKTNESLSGQNDESVSTKSSSPLIFISHDTRDAELAEEFSNLLKSASAGALKSFVSSDKKGTRGIEYGLEWYPAIMEKIDEASEVVCLLTQRSVERPWILYEAGVAKGKLGKKVIGVAVGIQHSVAFTGPFAQFQNNDGSVDAVTKLVIDLVKKVPGLDPDTNLVKQLVESFNKKANEIIKKSQTNKDKPAEESSEKLVAKLFEEIKIMFENLPSRIENKLDPDIKRKRRRLHPLFFEDIIHFGTKSTNHNIGFLMLLSIFKDDFPWLYEIGLETYRGLKTAKTIAAKKKLISEFDKAFDMIRHPVMMEVYGKSEEMYMFGKEASHFMHRFLDNYLVEEKTLKKG